MQEQYTRNKQELFVSKYANKYDLSFYYLLIDFIFLPFNKWVDLKMNYM